MGNSRSLQPPPQLAVVAIDLISSNPAEGGLLIPAPASALAGPVAAWSESRHSPAPQPPAAAPSLPPTPGAGTIPGPAGFCPWRWHRPENANLTVLDPPRRPAVGCRCTPTDFSPFLRNPSLVHHQHRVSGGQMLHQRRISCHHEPGPHPTSARLYNRRCTPSVASPACSAKLPPVLALYGTDQSPQVVQYHAAAASGAPRNRPAMQE